MNENSIPVSEGISVKLITDITASDVSAQDSIASKHTKTQKPKKLYKTFQASGETSAGVGAASVLIQVSSDGEDWVLMGTISLTLGTSPSADGFASNEAWPFVRAFVAIGGITGTDGTVNVMMGA